MNEEEMVRLLPEARKFARPPISNFHVGAVGLGASGALYLGANLEIGGNALNQTVHAEQAVIANAHAHEEKGLVAIATTAAPCGHCRQFLNEVNEAMRVVIEGQPTRMLSDLLPSSFGPKDLGVNGNMFNSAPLELRVRSNDGLTQAAVRAASRAYAPYSKSHSGCAIAMKSGRTVAGSYLENAAFNPSLSPLQAALVNAVIAGEDLASIERAVLVERGNAPITQRAATEAALAALSPKARLDVVHAL